MSWSVAMMGHAEGICAALDEHEKTLRDNSLLEFREVKQELKALLLRCHANGGAPYTKPVIDFEASGSCVFKMAADGRPDGVLQSSLTVSIKPIWKKIV